jgi:hypothetical protein
LIWPEKLGNVAEACRNFGVSRTRYYEWKSLAERYGLEALMPKARRTPRLPNATPPTWWPSCSPWRWWSQTVGCRQYADRLEDRGYSIAPSTVQRHLMAHGLGKLAQRTARAAAITMMTRRLAFGAQVDLTEGRRLNPLSSWKTIQASLPWQI